MSATRSFVDTNVLVYVHDDDEPVKQVRARSIMDDDARWMVISTQVLGEFYVTVTRKLRPPMAPSVATDLVEQFSRLPMIAIDAQLVRAAIETAQRSQVSYWDALIVEAAVAGGCDRVLTEDLAGGSVIRGVRIENPFDGLST